MSRHRPLIVINVVGLTRRFLNLMPRTKSRFPLSNVQLLTPVLPAVTMTAQASILTGRPAGDAMIDGQLIKGHGIVANGWLFRDTMEVRFWQQASPLLQAEPIYSTLKRRYQEQGEDFHVAKLFWWFNQGAEVDLSVTPKPHYGSDGNKIFDIDVYPRNVKSRFKALGDFPFSAFWGPMSGIASSDWITRLAEQVILEGRGALKPGDSPKFSSDQPLPKEYSPFDLTLIYLPHLDYDPQRFGPGGCDLQKCATELDESISRVLAAADRTNSEVWLVSEYGHVDVTTPVFLNQILREQGLLEVRSGPFGEVLDTHNSRAFAVVDHQLAHLYVKNAEDIPALLEQVRKIPGVAQALAGDDRKQWGLDHPRSGEIILTSNPDCWFAYPYWLDEKCAPDFAACVDIHRKPGFDPCEMFFDENLKIPKMKAAWRLLQKKLGFRTRFDVISLNAHLTRGSHGLASNQPDDSPILVRDSAAESDNPLPMTAVYDRLLQRLSPTQK